jgi:CheY-like chemotaxis protein
MRVRAEQKGLILSIDQSSEFPRFVKSDSAKLRQILINLLGNAVRFTDSGGITLLLDHTREVARFCVIDTGIGIATQDLERIFLPFERGSAGRRSGEPGTGLGLTITHLLTQLMGGELTVTSEPGRGSTFSVRLYLSETTEPGYARTPRHRPVTGYIGARRTLLVVDDHPTQRQMLAGMLLPLGFRIGEAASGRECLESLQDGPPDAVLLDLSMDDMDGWETARRIRERGFTDLPVIIVSANAFENQPERLAAARCQGFVDKPVIESELLAVLQRELELEWTAELALPSWAVPEAAPQVRLPADHVRTLLRLSRLGHPSGMRQALDVLVGEHPECAPQVEALRELIARFAWHDLGLQLAGALDGSESDDAGATALEAGEEA